MKQVSGINQRDQVSRWSIGKIVISKVINLVVSEVSDTIWFKIIMCFIVKLVVTQMKIILCLADAT